MMSYNRLRTLFVVILAGLISAPGHSQTAPAADVAIRVDAATVKRQMTGGIGASWHSMPTEAWGGNPPLENTKFWAQIEGHARWLGLDFIRVELEQRMYEPERGKFDWENQDMRTLYRILDWCQANHADVFLQQMFSRVEWNAIPGVDAWNSAPKSMDDFVEGFATMVDHLVNKKKYTCIRWLCITNEPENGWSWWKDAKGNLPVAPGLHAVRKGLDARGISLPLSGPDWAGWFNCPQKTPARLLAFDDAVGAYDIHSYGPHAPTWKPGEDWQQGIAGWTQWAHERNKPFFLSEFGVFGRNNTYTGVIHNATTVLRGLAVGVDGFNRWSFISAGGPWPLVRTWDEKKKQYLSEAIPQPIIYHGYGLITRFAAKHSAILACETFGGSDLLAAAIRSPKGNLTLWLLNLSAEPKNARVTVAGLDKPMRVFAYQVTEAASKEAGFTLRPGQALTLSSEAAEVQLPPLSFTALSSFALQPEDPGIIEDENAKETF